MCACVFVRTAPDERDIDDEYRHAGEEDPKIFLTTCRDPSSRLVQFAKELKLVFPNCQRMNRGAYVIKDLVSGCRASGVTDLVILHETRGRPDGMIVSHLPYGPTAYFGISNCVMRHDLGGVPTMSLAFPHLVFTNFSTKIGERVCTCGVEWSGVEWSGVEWNGVEWRGVERRGVEWSAEC
jgi:U3 small nucleolar ribonucleoprotein protein IMP4